MPVFSGCLWMTGPKIMIDLSSYKKKQLSVLSKLFSIITSLKILWPVKRIKRESPNALLCCIISFEPQGYGWTCWHRDLTLQTCSLHLSTPLTWPPLLEPLATHRDTVTKMRQTCTGHLPLGVNLPLQSRGSPL